MLRRTSALTLFVLAQGCASQAPEHLTSREQRLVGGEFASPEQFEATVYYQGNGFACTGAMVGQYELLTAAHCVLKEDRVTPRIPPGSVIHISPSETIDPDAVFWDREVEATSPHESYPKGQPQHLTADIAIIRLKAPLPGPFATIDAASVQDGEEVHFSGYGCEALDKSFGEDGKPNHKTGVNIVDPAYNAEGHADFHAVSKPGTSVYSCSGDSGSPLYRLALGGAVSIVGVVYGGTNADYSAVGRVDNQHYAVHDWLKTLTTPPPPDPEDAGTEAAVAEDGGGNSPVDGQAPASDAGGGSAAAPAEADAGDDGGCRATSGRTPNHAISLWLVFAAVVWARRRQRHPRSC